MVISTGCKPKEKAELQGLQLNLLLRFDLAKHWISSAPTSVIQKKLNVFCKQWSHQAWVIYCIQNTEDDFVTSEENSGKIWKEDQNPVREKYQVVTLEQGDPQRGQKGEGELPDTWLNKGSQEYQCEVRKGADLWKHSPVLCIIPYAPWLYVVSCLTITPDKQANSHKQKESKNWHWYSHGGTQRKRGARACWAAWKPSRCGPSLCQLYLSSIFCHGHETRHNCLPLIQLCSLSPSSHTTLLTTTDISS